MLKKILVLMFITTGCTVVKSPIVSGVNQQAGIIEYKYEYGLLEKPQVNWDQVQTNAVTQCQSWGFQQTAKQIIQPVDQCIKVDQRNQKCIQHQVTTRYECQQTEAQITAKREQEEAEVERNEKAKKEAEINEKSRREKQRIEAEKYEENRKQQVTEFLRTNKFSNYIIEFACMDPINAGRDYGVSSALLNALDSSSYAYASVLTKKPFSELCQNSGVRLTDLGLLSKTKDIRKTKNGAFFLIKSTDVATLCVRALY